MFFILRDFPDWSGRAKNKIKFRKFNKKYHYVKDYFDQFEKTAELFQKSLIDLKIFWKQKERCSVNFIRNV